MNTSSASADFAVWCIFFERNASAYRMFDTRHIIVPRVERTAYFRYSLLADFAISQVGYVLDRSRAE